LRIVPKDLGPTNDVSPSPHNAVTITRYRVVYRRADGRNQQGVDVPYAFDGAVTATVAGEAATTVAFEMVRHSAKQEPPLVQLTSDITIINCIAEVTFWGRDQAGNELSVTGSIQVDFGNFGDES
jgi:hypothetical protein